MNDDRLTELSDLAAALAEAAKDIDGLRKQTNEIRKRAEKDGKQKIPTEQKSESVTASEEPLELVAGEIPEYDLSGKLVRRVFSFKPGLNELMDSVAEKDNLSTAQLLRIAFFVVTLYPELKELEAVQKAARQYDRSLGPSRHHPKPKDGEGGPD